MAAPDKRGVLVTLTLSLVFPLIQLALLDNDTFPSDEAFLYFGGPPTVVSRMGPSGETSLCFLRFKSLQIHLA